MIRIVEPKDGAILNKNDGKQTSRGLEITVKGTISDGYDEVWVNDTRSEVTREEFASNVVLEERENRIVAFGRGKEGKRAADVITVLWDQNSIKRYRFSVDDNIVWLKDLAMNSTKHHSIFDNEFLGFWRQMHEKFGTKIQFNIYYQTEGFSLAQMPEKYKAEWLENADWLRLTFHALQHKPDEPYKNATYLEIKRDYLLVTRQIERFAGKDLLSTFTTVHWAEAPLEACVALRNLGIEGLVGYFTLMSMDNDRGTPLPRPRVSYYLNKEETSYLVTHDYWKDMRTGIIFIRHDIIMDWLRQDEIVPRLNEVARNPHQSEIIEMLIHEYNYYRQPNFKAKVVAGLEWATNKGYRSVFYDEGFIGA